MQSINKIYYTVSEYADKLGLSKWTVYYYIKNNLIPIKRGRNGKIFIINK